MSSTTAKWNLFSLLFFAANVCSAADIAREDIAPSVPATPAAYPRTEVEGGFSYEHLTNNFPRWRSLYVEGAHYYDARRVLYGAFNETDRSALVDHEAQAGLYQPVDAKSTVLFETTYSASHLTLPKWSALAQWEHSFPDGWGTQFGVRHREYADTRVNIGGLTIERYFGDYRAAYTLYRSDVQTAGWATSHVLQIARYYGERNSVGLVYANGRELDFDPASQSTLLFDIRGLAITGRHWITRAWAISYSISDQEQGNAYTRRGIALGLRRAF